MRVAALCSLLLGAVLAAGLPAFGQEAVQRVDVQVAYHGQAPHALVQERIRATVASVAERLLLGRAVDAALQLSPRLPETFAVLERVITGYAVVSVEAAIGPVTNVAVLLRPRGDLVRQTAVRLDLRDISERLHPLVTGLLQPAIDQVRGFPVGLPVSADWAVPLLEDQARSVIERTLTGYTAGMTLRLEPAAAMGVAVRPRDSRVIRNVGVRFRSTTLPTLLLDQHAPAVASLSGFLRGVPVAFAAEQSSALERLLTDDLRNYPPVRQYAIIATAALQAGETTFVTVIADSVRYRASVEAHLNIGVGAPGPAVVARAGRFIAPGVDTFLELRLVPNTLSLEWDVGSSLALGPATAVGVRYTVPRGAVTLWTTIGLTPDLSLRGEWDTTARTFEGGLRYRLNAFLAWELVGTPTQVWLRLVSNL